MTTSKLLLIAAFFNLGSSSFAAPAFWDTLVGCYKTIEWNGQAVSVNAAFNQTEIYKDNSMFLTELDGSSIPSFAMLIYQETTPETSNFSYASPFENKGTYSEQNNKFKFNFEGELQYAFQTGFKLNVIHNVEVERLANGNVWLHNLIQIKETDQFNRDETFVLMPVTCIDPTI